MAVFISLLFPFILQKTPGSDHVENGYVERPRKMIWAFGGDIGWFRNTLLICRVKAGQEEVRNCISDYLNYIELPENPTMV